MKNIRIQDATLCLLGSAFTFKEKTEIARQLDLLGVDCIELPALTKGKADTLFVRTVLSFVKNGVSVAADSPKSVAEAKEALAGSKNGIIRIELPVSAIGMEYGYHKKAPKMLEYIKETVSAAADGCTAEFCALDATRAEPDFLYEVIKTAVEAGAEYITLCDDAGEMLPDDFAAFIGSSIKDIETPVSVSLKDVGGVALASAVLAVKAGADGIKTTVIGDGTSLEKTAGLIYSFGQKYGFASNINYTNLHRTVMQIERISSNALNNRSTVSDVPEDNEKLLDKNDSKEEVLTFAATLGYDLSEEDGENVYGEFKRVAEKKAVGVKELDAIIFSSALQVPAIYKLDNYIVNNGNIISTSAQVTLEKDGVKKQGISIGDGPIDAAFLAIEQITGRHYELDDFQIQTVTKSKESVGSAVVKLRSSGKIYSGNGISTDIIEASIRAYISAVNKIAYEEA